MKRLTKIAVLVLFIAAFAFSACIVDNTNDSPPSNGNDSPLPGGGDSQFPDNDGDGFTAENDCNDKDRFSYPGAPEIACDNKDNNCNGETDEEEIVVFEDENLRKTILASLEKPVDHVLTNYDLCELELLNAFFKSIANIKGLEYAYNLSQLNLGSNSINDLRPLIINGGIGTGDVINLYNNSLDTGDCTDLQTLIERGANVNHNVACK